METSDTPITDAILDQHQMTWDDAFPWADTTRKLERDRATLVAALTTILAETVAAVGPAETAIAVDSIRKRARAALAEVQS